MAVRSLAIRTILEGGRFVTTGLAALVMAGGISARSADAAPGVWGASTPRSVLVQPATTPSRPAMARNRQVEEIPEGAVVGDQGIAFEEVPGAPVAAEPFDASMPEQGVIVGSSEPQAGTSYDDFATGGQGYGDQYPGPMEPGQLAYDDQGYPVCNGQCHGGCQSCQAGAGFDPAWRFNAFCEPAGLMQKLWCHCRKWESDGCWTGRVDALILSRSAPSYRPLYSLNAPAVGPALNANDLESLPAVGPRISLFHRDNCGKAWEGTYFYTGSFVSERSLAPLPNGYALPAPGIYGVLTPDPTAGFDSATARLASSLQSAEINHRWNLGPCSQFLAGFRWLYWQESLTITDSFGAGAGSDLYATNTFNNLFGGQIGLDTLLWQPSKHFRMEGLMKAGAYYNSASQSSYYQGNVGGVPFYANGVNVGMSPATASFVGELGLTGVIPICCNVDLRIGYFGLWLTSLAQPTNQLAGQTLIEGAATSGSLATNGNVVLQGLSLGLESRW
jgi:hypothetical protein